ncbi:hypothetical protein DNAM5_7 [Haloarcula californiae tailed virus 1]|uniref:Uncharacterized protein n=1 Tax=Haloarcula californiae tailed virus 1 TaxID=1273746 RepID=R4TAA2_9CAUD|nr:hypothetical protein M202_gp007 [Haloarcula californiae tailed virus 1]AGM11870.1 hypothetical protein DNAM5_7 [Haloarcula californiae tailed virus 1]
MYDTAEEVIRTLKARIEEDDEMELVGQNSSFRGIILLVKSTNEDAPYSITADMETTVASTYTSPQDEDNEYRIGIPLEVGN